MRHHESANTVKLLSSKLSEVQSIEASFSAPRSGSRQATCVDVPVSRRIREAYTRGITVVQHPSEWLPSPEGRGLFNGDEQGRRTTPRQLANAAGRLQSVTVPAAAGVGNARAVVPPSTAPRSAAAANRRARAPETPTPTTSPV